MNVTNAIDLAIAESQNQVIASIDFNTKDTTDLLPKNTLLSTICTY